MLRAEEKCSFIKLADIHYWLDRGHSSQDFLLTLQSRYSRWLQIQNNSWFVFSSLFSVATSRNGSLAKIKQENPSLGTWKLMKRILVNQHLVVPFLHLITSKVSTQEIPQNTWPILSKLLRSSKSIEIRNFQNHKKPTEIQYHNTVQFCVIKYNFWYFSGTEAITLVKSRKINVKQL